MQVIVKYNALLRIRNTHIAIHYEFLVGTFLCTVLPRITTWAFISFQQFLTRPLNETDDYYWKKYVLFIFCDASDEFLMGADDT